MNNTYTKNDGIFAVVYAVLGFLFIRFFLFYDWRTNFNFVLKLYTLAYIGTVYAYAKAKGKTLSKEGYFWIGIMLVVAFFCKLENFFTLLIQIGLAAYFTSLMGGLISGGTGAYLAVDLLDTFVSKPFMNFFTIVPAFFTLFKKSEKKEKQPVPPAVWGVVLGVGALWFILPLLTSADSNFLSGTTDFISHIFDSFNSVEIYEYLFMFAFSVPVSCYLFGLSYASFCGKGFAAEDVVRARENSRVAQSVTLKVFVYIVCAVYILFMALQANYLLGAFMGRLYGGMTYAQYARTGFFELTKVSAINLSILALCNLVIRKEESDRLKIPQLSLCVLSLMLLSTAMAKMIMYISVYGLTFKRVVSSVFLVWLVIVFLLCIARLYRQFNLTKAAMMIGAVMFSFMFSFDIGKHRYNFNVKYGFEEKTPQKEYRFNENYNSLILPDISDVTAIEITDNQGNFYSEISATGEVIDLLCDSIDTEKTPMQDFPSSDYYYTLNILYTPQEDGDSDITTLYIYKDGDYFYIEQPYYLICRSYYDWDGILSTYKY